MKKFSKLNEKQSDNLLENVINDIDELISNLEYLRSFIDKKKNSEDNLKIYKSLITVHTDIQLLSSKIKK
jgi:cob(I)alamin adenosyltransferase